MKDITPVGGQFAMPQLPYVELPGVVSRNTFDFHHGKHLKAYVDNLNKLLPGSGLENLPLSEVVRQSQGALFNNAGQVLNHTMYFDQFSPAPHPASASLLALFERDFGGMEAFQREFEQKGVSLFGSGWVCSHSMLTAVWSSRRNPMPATQLPAVCVRCSPSTCGSTPTISTTRTAAPTICMPCGRWWTGAKWRREFKTEA